MDSRAFRIDGTKMGPKTGPLRRARLTATRLDALTSEATAYDVPDPDYPGLILHVAARKSNGSPGTKSWQWRFYWKGKREKITLGRHPHTGLADAHDRVRHAREAIEKGIDPRKSGLGRTRSAATPVASGGVHVAAPNSVEALVEEFLRRFITPHRKHPQDVRRMLDKEVLSAWAGRDARSIKPRDVLALLDGIVDRGSPIMANRVASLLGQLFKYAVHRDLIETTPVQLLYAPGGEEKPRNRALNDTELAALLTHMDDVMARAPRTVATMRLILFTACRRSEIALARWNHFHLNAEAPTWHVPAELSKTGVECLIPLVPGAVAELKRLKRNAGRSPWLFPNGAKDEAADPKILTRSLNRHLKFLAQKHIKPFTLHDLRRTVRTGLSRLKVLPHIAERVLNHAQPGMAGVYDVYAYLDEKREALDKWAAYLAGLTAPAPPAAASQSAPA